jgi:plastocyanin
MGRRRVLVLVTAVVMALASAGGAAAFAAEEGGPPHPDPAFLGQVPGQPCTVDNEYEAHQYGMSIGDVRHPGKCERIKFTFGPIVVKPGENDAIIQPVTIEKPAYNGYVVRFKPDLVRAADGEATPTEVMHLHHATWLNAGSSYGSGPFFAAGEEKTIMTMPEGYGMRVGAQDAWLMLYMVHNAGATSDIVWLTYDIDFIAESAAQEMGIAPVKPIWLDVQKSRIHPEAPDSSSNPVFNVHRGFGDIDPETGRRVCVWPRQNCARFDTYNTVTPNQGTTTDRAGNPIKIEGNDFRVPASLAGTLIGIGGHLHPGGIRNEVSLVRNGVEKPIMISDALYWNFENPSQAGERPHSWNMSMTVAGAPFWKVKIREGDILRKNAVVDSQDASWYEGMGIAVAYVAPDDPHAPAGVDVFDDNVIIDRGVSTAALTPDGPWVDGGWRPNDCEADLTGATKRLCLRGQPTHGAVAESGNSGGCPAGGCPPLPDKEGPLVEDIVSGAMSFGNADFGVIPTAGIPRVKKGQQVRFWNVDGPARIWHTFTRCAEPCTGRTGVAYPIADGGTGPDDEMDFDSAEIGYGLPWEPASGRLGGHKPMQDNIRDSLLWEFTPTETGTYAFWCRIHPSMRGAVKVVE